MKNRSALKLTEEEMNFLHNKDGLSRLEKKNLSPSYSEKNRSRSKSKKNNKK